MAIVIFSFSAWVTRYPELAGSVNSTIAQMYFNEATLYCDNTDCSSVTDVTTRAVLLNMLTAHICAMNAYINGAVPSQSVGRLSSATEGSVSVTLQMDVAAGSAQWYAQTKYGAAYWAATARYRMFQYEPGPQFDADPYDRIGGF